MTIINSTMTTKEINKKLNGNDRCFFFEKGIYRMKDTMVLHSDSIVYANGATFERHHKGRMLEAYVTPRIKGYDGENNIKWFGGLFVADTSDDKAIVISLFHASNILISGVSVKGCRELHSIEINACKDVIIDNCKVTKQSGDTCTFREAIQIDFANYDGLKIKGAKSDSACYDGTHCKGITINNCYFNDCPNGIGTHTVGVDNKYHTDIKLLNNVFYNISGKEIRLLGMKNVIISGVGKVHDDTIKTAHQLSGGKVKLNKARKNKNVTII